MAPEYGEEPPRNSRDRAEGHVYHIFEKFFLTGMKGYNSLPPSAAPLRHIQSRAEGFNLDRVRTVPDPHHQRITLREAALECLLPIAACRSIEQKRPICIEELAKI